MNVHEVKSIETKSILSRLKSKDNYWGIAYNMNLYSANMVAFIVIHVVLAMVLVIFLISL
jgi:hypothetical protein